MSLKINVAIVDDEELFRVGISYILTKDEKINIVFDASNGEELLEYLAETKALPDVIIMDIKMPKLNGVEATKIISKTYPKVSIIALSTYNTKPFIRNMLDVGAAAYLVKNSSPSEVIHTIKQVYFNGFYYDNKVLKIINNRFALNNKASKKSIFDEKFLTAREKEILELICLQFTTAQIGEKLCISPRTIEVHRKNLLVKAGVKNSTGLVIFAITNSLVPPLF